ncbi:MAG: ABC transporter ATP-binding protein [Rhodobacterales bacterium]|nr:ABC transporter ATP-binding protein [Rhodobacterales bacterium]
MTAISLTDVHHAYGANTVVRGVGFDAGPGTLTCLLGPSGCGKTTLLRLAAGLEPLQRGAIAIGGETVADPARGIDVPTEKRGVGLMFQDYALFPHLDVLGNITFGIADRPRERQTWAHLALERMDLAALARAYPHTLSGGQMQRVALLRALAPEPRVLLLDEPFSGLDVTRRAQVREETLALLRETGVASVMVTHDPEEAMFMADSLLVMDQGRIVQAGRPADIYFQPASAFVAALFGPVNRLEGRVAGGRVDSPLGPFPAPGLAEGTRAQVLVRPEGLAVVAGPALNGACPARVDFARLLGRSSHLRLRGGDSAADLVLEARVPGVFLPDDGAAVAVTVDPDQAFVFPLDG